MPAPAETRTVRRDGCTIACRIDGAERAPALLLSNALGTSFDMWAPQMPALSTSFRVVRYDTRGHGRSDVPRNPYTIDQLGLDAVAVLDAGGIDRAHVCGLSLGGLTAMWMAINVPSRVRSLVLAATAPRIGSADLWNTRIGQVRAGGTESIADAVMLRWFTDEFRQAQPEAVSTYREMLTSTAADGYAGCCAAIRDTDFTHAIERIAVPTLVIVGAADPATPPSDGDAIRQRVPSARMVTLNASHMVNVEQPSDFSQAVMDFLGRPQHATGAKTING